MTPYLVALLVGLLTFLAWVCLTADRAYCPFCCRRRPIQVRCDNGDVLYVCGRCASVWRPGSSEL